MGPLLVGMLLAAQAPAGPAGPLFLVPSPRGGTMADLFLVDPATGDSKNVTRTEADEELDPAWSPDGKSVAFMRVVAHKPCSLCLIAPDGTGERVLVADTGRSGAGSVAWSPDGTLIAYSAETPYGLQLFVVPAAGGAPRQLTHLPGINVHPVWLSADRLMFSNLRQMNAAGGAYGV